MNKRGVDVAFTNFGAVNSDDLFEEREQIIFDFYERHAQDYQTALDIGANIGIHSILMSRSWKVKAFEPDPETFKQLLENRAKNGVSFEAVNKAVSDKDGISTFVRVLGNTTSSHLDGCKKPYGPVDKFTVATTDCRPLFQWADFAKIDCEGHEATILTCCDAMLVPDCIVEVENTQNAYIIYEHFIGKRRMFSQKINWEEVTSAFHIPFNYQQGSLFIGENW